jgi:hypothetical protein
VVKKLVALIMTASIAGCAATPPRAILTPIEVKVPVATPVYCQVAKMNQPALPVAALHPDSAPADTMRAYAATVAILKGAVRQRDLVIEGCAPPVDAEAPAAPAKVESSSAIAEAPK